MTRKCRLDGRRQALYYFRVTLVLPQGPAIMKTISLKLPAELHTRLTQVSRKRNVAKSAVVRAALEAYFSQSRAGEPSCLDLAGDLVGSLEGPVDLATHPRHLKGYGR
jgi:hypothetical protein